ncbi:MAG: hypothetical protein E6K82_20620 [Candidatus Rokuibacteriota bacterium]|nr:MAG: hypothetical protein E6K82_20620 [Candidatus Rokubacteria bacterium]
MIAALLALVLLAGTAEALDVPLEPYRAASLTGVVGTVTGRIYAEARTPNGPVQPLTGTTVTLLPRSQALILELERLKEQSRQSAKAFTAAAPAMRKAQEAYERALLQAGAPDLAPRISVAADGAFRLTEVPAGDWLVVAWHSAPVDTSTPQGSARERQIYQLDKRLTGFQSVTVWLREVAVARGETASLELTDRNGWFRGVIEEKVLDTGR